MNAQPTAAAAGTIDVGGDLTVNRLGFGAMRITGRGIWGNPPSRDQAIATLRRVVELGVNFIDTADSYGPDVSETLIAEALFPYPDDLVIATKGGLVRPGPNRWEPDGRPDRQPDGQPAGQLGELHPALMQAMDLEGRAVAIELDLEPVLAVRTEQELAARERSADLAR